MLQGIARLYVSAGEFPARATEEATFLIVDQPSQYNSIFGRLALSQFHIAPSTYHQLMKFLMIRWVGQVKGDQEDSRLCYGTRVQKESLAKAIQINFNPREEKTQQKNNLVKSWWNLQIILGEPNKVVKVGFELDRQVLITLEALLLASVEAFAWLHEDIPETDRKITERRINVDPQAKLVCQKKRFLYKMKCSFGAIT